MSGICLKKTMSKLLAVCIGSSALMGLTLGSVSADTGMSDNLLKNGSFEAPVYTAGETITDTTPTEETVYLAGGTVTVEAQNASQGTQSLKLPAGAGVNQLVQLEAGKEYVFSVDLYAESNNRFQLSLYKYNADSTTTYIKSENSGDFTGWKKIKRIIQVDENCTVRLKMEMVGNGYQGETYLDNIRMTELKPGVVYDGSFEDSLVGSDFTADTFGVYTTGTVVDDKAKEGSKSLQIANGIHNIYIPVEAAATYDFTAYVWVASGQTATIQREQYLLAAGQNTAYNNLGSIRIAGNDSWNKIHISVTTGANDNKVRFKLTTDGVSNIDNICLTKDVAEPGVFRNGGFESPAYDAGSYSATTQNLKTINIQSGTAEIVTDIYSEGSQSLKLSNRAAINQLVSLEANKLYTFTLDMYVPKNTTNRFNLSVYNAAGNGLLVVVPNNSGDIAGDDQWHTVTMQFTAPETYNARFKMEMTQASDVYLDNIRLIEYVPDVAEPGVFYNGSFENYELGAYTTIKYGYKVFGIGTIEAEIVDDPVSDGNKALKMTAGEDAIGGDTAMINQNAVLEADKIYQISMDVLVPAESTNAIKLCVVANADEDHAAAEWFVNNIYSENISSGEWVRVTKTFKAPRDCSARFKISLANAGSLYLDNIQLHEISLDEADFEFDHGTPSTLTVGNAYKGHFPEGKLFAAQYDSDGRLLTVNFADEKVEFTPVEQAATVKIIALDSFGIMKSLKTHQEFKVEQAQH